VQADAQYTALANAAGTCTITIRPTGRQTWTVGQVSVQMATAATGPPAVLGATASTRCGVYKNGFLISPLVATGDAASNPPPVVLYPADTMTVVWTGAQAGAQGRAMIIYDDGM
jgi:hypothetical protein